MELENVEQTYKKLSQLEHIIKRPDTYVGSCEFQSQQMWVMSREDSEQFEYRNIDYVPGLYKIFDEILVNAADNYQRDKKMNTIKVVINQEKNFISVQNNGKGIPVQIHKTENMYVPELIFGHLLTSSNYNDNQKKITGGRNGYGAKLANIFSKEFTIETADSKSGKKFKKTWRDNMSKSDEAEIVSYREGDFTKISFSPDLRKFHMKRLDDDIVDLMKKRVYDMAGIVGGSVKCYLNGDIIPIKGFQQYVDMYLSANQKMNCDSKIIKVTDAKMNNSRWEVIVAFSEGQFQQVSFANSICTIKGGTHVDYVTNQIIDKVLESMKKKKEKGTVIKPFHVKQHLWVFVNALIENPSFDSQTKETLTLKSNAFGSGIEVTDKLVKDLIKEGLANHVMLQAKAKEQAKMSKKLSGKKESRLIGIPKLEDANEAGTRYADQCTLILTEGDSAKSLAMSGIEVVGRDRYGVFPLKGKMLNVREASTKQITENQEIQNVMKTMGLQLGKKYEDVKSLRYGSIMIMADQDTDGSHIKGLFVNFVQNFWPTLYRMPGFLKSFITPLIKAKKGSEVHPFYTQQDFDEWVKGIDNPAKWTFKYYKGLGTSTDKEAQQYFRNLNTHVIKFQYVNQLDDEAIDLAFNKKKADDRKQWLADFDPKTCVDYSIKSLKYRDFVNQELIQFSIADCNRSIPSLLDGLKPGQRKILYSCFKRNLKQEIKVAQLSGYVAEHSAYHHGEASLAQTIIGMAQNFVGSNNINYLLPIGQYGSRNQGGKEAASARYIHTNLNKITRVIYPDPDDHILKYLEDDGQMIEPEYYIPIIPMILVNGADGIGTGWSTNIPQYNPRHIVDAIREKLSTEKSFQELIPWYKGFTGDISENPKGGFVIKGSYNILAEDTIEITEIPIKRWTRDYKTFLEENMQTKEKDGEPDIENIKEYHAGNRVHFVVKMTPKGCAQLSDHDTIEKYFKLNGSITTTNLVLFDTENKLKRYRGIGDIITEFYYQRLAGYERRKEYLISKIQRDVEILSNKQRFIQAVIKKEIIIQNVKKSVIVTDLIAKGFKQMKNMTQIKSTKLNKISNKVEEARNNEEDESLGEGKEFNYLLGMPLWSLTYEKVEDIKKQVEDKEAELRSLKMQTVQSMWTKDLDLFEEVLDDIEEAEEREIQQRFKQMGKGVGNVGKNQKGKKNKKQLESDDESEDYDDDDDSEFESKKKKKSSQNNSKKSKKNQSAFDGYTPTLSQETGISSRGTKIKYCNNTISNSQPVEVVSKKKSTNNYTQNSQNDIEIEIETKPKSKTKENGVKKNISMSQQPEKPASIFECDKEAEKQKEEEKKKEEKNSLLSSILKYLPSSQPTNTQNSQGDNNNTSGGLSLAERLLMKNSQDNAFDKGYKEQKTKLDKESVQKTKEKTSVDIGKEKQYDDILIEMDISDDDNNKDLENNKSIGNSQTLKRKGDFSQKKQPETKKKINTGVSKKRRLGSDTDEDLSEKENDFIISDEEESENLLPKKKKAAPAKKNSSQGSKDPKKNSKGSQSQQSKKTKKKESSEFDDISDNESNGIKDENIVQSQTSRGGRRAAATKKVNYKLDISDESGEKDDDDSECQF